MIKAVIFDCFGVLVGTGFWSVYRRLGGDPEQDASFITEQLEAANSGRIPTELFRQRMAERLGVSLDQYQAAFTADEAPNQPIFDYIAQELKPHYKIGLLSNAGAGVIEQRIPPNLLQLFDSVVVSADVGLLKPDAAIFRLAAQRLKVQPQQAVFTDDHAQYLTGAAAVGMHTVLYKDLADFIQQFRHVLDTDETVVARNADS